MTSTTPTPEFDTIFYREVGCGPDCVVIDGACRCYHQQATTRDFKDQALNDLVPPF
jgi:hypothetical protein